MIKERPKTWYRTDNAGRIYAVSAHVRLRSLFRVSAILKSPIQVETLQEALEAIMPRFPFFAVHVRRGMFWSFLQANRTPPHILADARFPCHHLPVHRGQALPFRVRAYHKRIAIEFSHIITDGSGALHFLRCLLAEYLRRHEGLTIEEPGDLLMCNQEPLDEEFEDAFGRYHEPGLPHPAPRPRAWHLPQLVDPTGGYHIITGLLSIRALKEKAQQQDCSINDYLLCNLLTVLQGLWLEAPRRPRFPITLDVPVNLRRFFPSPTLRNFFVTSAVTLDPRLGQYSEDEIRIKIQHQLRSQLDPKELKRYITRNVGAERNLFIRLIPFFLKGRILPEIYRRMSLRTSTSSLSNLGGITLPSPLDQAVERFDLIPVHPNQRKLGCACIGYGDTLSISFARTLSEPIVERAFFRRLTDSGLKVRLETNSE